MHGAPRWWYAPALVQSVRRLSLALALTAFIGGCNGPENVILVDVYSQASVETLNVRVISLDGLGVPFDLPAVPFAPARSADELLDTPIRVAIRLEGETTAMVHFTARTPDGRTLVATRCYGVTAALRDEVVLVDIGALDRDGDTFLSDPSEACREPTPGDTAGRSCTPTDLYICPTEAAADCDDEARDPMSTATECRPDTRDELNGFCIFPGAAIVCQNGIDEDCDGDVDEACVDADGDGVNACPETETVGCDCDDTDPNRNPRADDICLDGIDQDCDGVDACCDADGDGYTQCRVGGVRTGDCVDVAEDCLLETPPCDPATVDPASVNPGATEICFDSLDNNCNGVRNEIGECLGPDFDRDGVSVCGMEAAGQPCEDRIYDCDAGISPEARERCRPVGVDDDLDGRVDEGCPAGDMDGDGQVAPRDCDDTDPLAYTHEAGAFVIERCEDGVAQSCVPGEDASCAGDTDGDGFIEPAACEGNAAINPEALEICNGIDDNCDGVIDEVVVPGMGCGRSDTDAVEITFATNIEHCGSCRFNCNDEFTHEFGSAADICADGICDCSTEPDVGDPATPAACAFGDRPTCCTDGCRDTANDPLNCGGCGVTCGAGESCVNGLCACGDVIAPEFAAQACPETGGGSEANQCCGGECRDVTVDGTNCGSCGTVCGPTTMCNDRICVCDPAQPNMDDCNGDIGMPGGNGCETDLLTTRVHCGRCGARCNPTNANGACVAGSCTIATCDTDWDDCDGLVGNGCEGNLTSLTHCNACGMTCTLSGATATCARRVCEIASCGSNFSDCNGSDADGCETPLGTVMNCARCGDTCNTPNATPRCNSGRNCVIDRCDDGWMDCNGIPDDGCEVNIDTDANCGGCGNSCGPNATCTSRACSCDMGWLDCPTGSPYCEVPFSTSNCGACNIACGTNESCTGAGECSCGGTGGGVGLGAVCTGNRRCCGSGCRTMGTTSNCSDCNDRCGTNETCTGSGPWACRCDGALRCGGSDSCCPGSGGCVDTDTDENNCGGCGVRCATGETCRGGTCQCGAGSTWEPMCTGTDVCCGAAGCLTLGTNANCSTCGDACTLPQTCGGGGASNMCGCTPTTCGDLGFDCGLAPDGCGGTLDCGTCTGGDSCGGGGTANVCGCTPDTCGSLGFDCGSVSDGCGGTLNCGTCTGGDSCGGGGTANVCGCTPDTCGSLGFDCGSASDGCGGTLSCGTCTGTDTCGGGGTANVCGCTPTTCADAGATCGSPSDGCGGTLSCGPCSTNEVCNGSYMCECVAGYGDCTGAAGCETTLGTDTNCSGCGDTCTGGETCGGGGTAGVCGS